jgi:hypothetical protein
MPFQQKKVKGKITPVGKHHREPLLPTEKEARWAPKPILTFREEKSVLPLPGIKPRFLGHPACTLQN